MIPMQRILRRAFQEKELYMIKTKQSKTKKKTKQKLKEDPQGVIIKKRVALKPIRCAWISV